MSTNEAIVSLGLHQSILLTLVFNFKLADHTVVLYAVTGVLITITLTIFVVILGIFFIVRFARVW